MEEKETVNQQESKTIDKGLFGTVLFFMSLLFIVFVLRTFVITPYQVPSGSMEDTISTGDMVIAEKVSLNFREFEHGDIIVFKDPEDYDRILVKRVIATEGQTVDLRNGSVYVDGNKLEEDYTKAGTSSYPLFDTLQEIEYPLVVPDDCVWVMGDNRNNSKDSRYFGVVNINSIVGCVFVKYWPIEHFGFLI